MYDDIDGWVVSGKGLPQVLMIVDVSDIFGGG
jgi:hypothetical protein